MTNPDSEIKTVKHVSSKGYYSNNDSNSRKKLPKLPRADSSNLLFQSQSRNKKKFLTV